MSKLWNLGGQTKIKKKDISLTCILNQTTKSVKGIRGLFV